MDISQHFFESLYEFLGVGSDRKSILALPHVNCALGTTRGPVRKENQDRAIVLRASFSNNPDSQFLLFALSDGIGGMADGASCARMTLSAFSNALINSSGRTIQDRIRQAFLTTNALVHQKFGGNSGATLSTLIVSKNDPFVITGNVGDSRIYKFESNDISTVEQLTVDDTIEARVAEIKHLNAEDIAPELKGRLAQFMGMPEGLEPSISKLDLRSDQSVGFALTTDGVHDIASNTFQRILVNCDDAEELASRLLDVAVWCGGNDNATSIIVSPNTIERFVRTTKPQRRAATVWSPYRQMEFALIGWQKERGENQEPSEKPKRKRPRKQKAKSDRVEKGEPSTEQPAEILDEKHDLDDEEIQMSIEFISEQVK